MIGVQLLRLASMVGVWRSHYCDIFETSLLSRNNQSHIYFKLCDVFCCTENAES